MNRVLEAAARAFVWALARDLARDPPEEEWHLHPLDPAEVRRLAEREVNAIRDSIIAHYDFQNREQRILSDRLARRFDLGMALNESAVRAIEEKQAAVPAGYPTPHQMRALEFQADQLTETLRRAPLR